MKAGTIGAYPEHSADIYTVRFTYPKDVRNDSGRLHLPPTGPKSMITNSIQDQNVLKSVTNYHIIMYSFKTRSIVFLKSQNLFFSRGLAHWQCLWTVHNVRDTLHMLKYNTLLTVLVLTDVKYHLMIFPSHRNQLIHRCSGSVPGQITIYRCTVPQKLTFHTVY